MNCAEIAAAMRLECTPMRGIHGEPVYEIGTPFSLPDGSALGLYVIDRGDFFELNDNADTMMNLSALGVDPWKNRRMSTLRNVTSPFGITINDDGALSLLARADALSFYLPRFIAGQLAVGSWVRDRLGVADEVVDFSDEVEIYLRSWRHNDSFSRNPEIPGISGQLYKFNFAVGNELIDAVSPRVRSTGSLMRKLGDVVNSGSNYTFRVIVDDRMDPVRAGVEMQIIGALATAMPYSSLLNHVEHGTA